MTLPWKALAKKYFQERQRLLAALAEPPVEELTDKEFWERIERGLPKLPMPVEEPLPPAPTTEPHLTHMEMMRQIEQTVKGPK